jgi:hypothetical protein
MTCRGAVMNGDGTVGVHLRCGCADPRTGTPASRIPGAAPTITVAALVHRRVLGRAAAAAVTAHGQHASRQFVLTPGMRPPVSSESWRGTAAVARWRPRRRGPVPSARSSRLSAVVTALEWPRSCWMTFKGTLAAPARLAAPWRRSWNRTGGRSSCWTSPEDGRIRSSTTDSQYSNQRRIVHVWRNDCCSGCSSAAASSRSAIPRESYPPRRTLVRRPLGPVTCIEKYQRP